MGRAPGDEGEDWIARGLQGHCHSLPQAPGPDDGDRRLWRLAFNFRHSSGIAGKPLQPPLQTNSLLWKSELFLRYCIIMAGIPQWPKGSGFLADASRSVCFFWGALARATMGLPPSIIDSALENSENSFSQSSASGFSIGFRRRWNPQFVALERFSPELFQQGMFQDIWRFSNE